MVLILVPICFEIFFISTLAFLLHSREVVLDDIAHSRDAIIALQKKIASVQRTMGVIASADEFTQAHQKEIEEISRQVQPSTDVSKLLNLRQFPELKELIAEVSQERESAHVFLSKILNVVHEPLSTNAQKREQLQKITTDNINLLLQLCFELGPLAQRIVEIESRVRIAQPEELRLLHWQLGWFLTLGLIVSSLISLFSAKLFTTNILGRLNAISENASALASNKPLSTPIPGEDEFSRLDRVLYLSSLILRDSRRREMAVLDNAVDVICSLDRDLNFDSVNLAVVKVWQYSPEELRGTSVLTLLSTDTIIDTRTAFESLMDGTHANVVEVAVRCKDGTIRETAWTVNWSNDKQRFFCVVHDVTELRNLERLKQRFISIASHDLRTPLSSVRISLDTVLDGKCGDVNEGVLGQLSRCKSSLERLTLLVNDLLELDRLEVGNIALNLDFLSIAYICQVARESLEGMATTAGVSIEGPSGDAAVEGDELRLVQVVTNLLSNAIKFSPSGSVITIGIARVDGSVQVSITDRGPGIHPAECALVFDKFRQLMAGTDNTRVKGTGLGLAIVRKIVEAHGGECGVVSEIDKGSTFWFRLKEFVDADDLEAPAE
ncbi:MAG: PAS domain-containing sensor histidine kinase [Cyanobacteria bacterium]|nr:PAS domain-containing sensor histidine kinase [Cyanobacteriota bacterium]